MAEGKVFESALTNVSNPQYVRGIDSSGRSIKVPASSFAKPSEVQELVSASEAERQRIFEQNEAQRQELPNKVAELELKVGTIKSNDYKDYEKDFGISDENGHVILSISNGHIKTKNFDSSNISPSPTPSASKGRILPQLIGHGQGYPSISNRGIKGNSMSHYRELVNLGYGFVECDVVNTSDGVGVLTHASGSGYKVYNSNDEEQTIYISQMTYAEVSQYKWTRSTDTYPNEAIITLEQLIFYCYVKGLYLWIDCQSTSKETIGNALNYAESLGNKDHIFVGGGVWDSSWTATNRITSASSTSAINTAAGYKRTDNDIIVNIPITLEAEEIKSLSDYAHSKGLYVSSFSSREVDVIRRYIWNGCDFVITGGTLNSEI